MKILQAATGPLEGQVALPGDKSIAHRALILGAMAEGGIAIRNLPDSADVASTRACLAALGSPFAAPRAPLDCGNSGTTMRLLAGVLAGHPFATTLIGDASLSLRPMARVAQPLALMGARIELRDDAHAPMTIHGQRPLAAIDHKLAVPSAQIKSAILLAALFADGVTTVRGATATRDHTERMLAWLGVDCATDTEGVISLTPGALRGGRQLTIPGDPSSAAFFMAAAQLIAGSRITLTGVALNPTRLQFARALDAAGARIEGLPSAAAAASLGANAGADSGVDANADAEADAGPEPCGDLTIHGGAVQLAAFDVPREAAAGLIDEIPIMAVLATAAQGRSRFAGLAELRVKESDRLASVAAGLASMGARVEVAGDDLIVDGPVKLHGAQIRTHGDHRIAMAFAIAALIASGETAIENPECVAISYPRFFEDLQRLRNLKR